MKKRLLFKSIHAVFAVAAFLFCVFAAPAKSEAQSSAGVKNIVLVHGAFADGSGWEAVYHMLAGHGYNVTVVQYPLTSLEDDVAAVSRALDRMNGPAILVGHSYGGALISQAGASDKVAGLVYVSAFVPDAGETVLQWAISAPPAAENGILPPDEKGFVYYDKAKFHAGFCADLSKEKAEFMYASQGAWAAKCAGTPLSQAAWKNKPCYAILSTEDKSIDPGVQRKMYERANAKITAIKGSHCTFISHPKEVASIIEQAAKNAGK
ncbi:alpha/beta hydrolase [Chitinophagaceae bacterium MMS25-I14]